MDRAGNEVLAMTIGVGIIVMFLGYSALNFIPPASFLFYLNL